jgi:excisionase family DNA binding protein
LKKDILSIPQAAKRCALNRVTLWKYVKSGELKASRTPGGHYRIHLKDLESFMRAKGMYPLANFQSEGKKILIVDDDSGVQKMLTKVLSSGEYEIEVASDGFEAGAKVIEFKPGLVILELLMPRMDGFEVCRRIKENANMFHVKILAITGCDTKENKDRIMSAGADGYMAKPLDMELLLLHVNDLLNRKENLPGIV